MDEPLETHTPDIVTTTTKPDATEAGNEDGAAPGKSIAEIKKQMMKEQRENQQSATGHDFGNSAFKLVGVHILEMYNPMKKFLQQASSGGKNADKDKDNSKN